MPLSQYTQNALRADALDFINIGSDDYVITVGPSLDSDKAELVLNAIAFDVPNITLSAHWGLEEYQAFHDLDVTTTPQDTLLVAGIAKNNMASDAFWVEFSFTPNQPSSTRLFHEIVHEVYTDFPQDIHLIHHLTSEPEWTMLVQAESNNQLHLIQPSGQSAYLPSLPVKTVVHTPTGLFGTSFLADWWGYYLLTQNGLVYNYEILNQQGDVIATAAYHTNKPYDMLVVMLTYQVAGNFLTTVSINSGSGDIDNNMKFVSPLYLNEPIKGESRLNIVSNPTGYTVTIGLDEQTLSLYLKPDGSIDHNKKWLYYSDSEDHLLFTSSLSTTDELCWSGGYAIEPHAVSFAGVHCMPHDDPLGGECYGSFLETSITVSDRITIRPVPWAPVNSPLKPRTVASHSQNEQVENFVLCRPMPTSTPTDTTSPPPSETHSSRRPTTTLTPIPTETSVSPSPSGTPGSRRPTASPTLFLTHTPGRTSTSTNTPSPTRPPPDDSATNTLVIALVVIGSSLLILILILLAYTRYAKHKKNVSPRLLNQAITYQSTGQSMPLISLKKPPPEWRIDFSEITRGSPAKLRLSLIECWKIIIFFSIRNKTIEELLRSCLCELDIANSNELLQILQYEQLKSIGEGRFVKQGRLQDNIPKPEDLRWGLRSEEEIVVEDTIAVDRHGPPTLNNTDSFVSFFVKIMTHTANFTRSSMRATYSTPFTAQSQMVYIQKYFDEISEPRECILRFMKILKQHSGRWQKKLHATLKFLANLKDTHNKTVQLLKLLEARDDLHGSVGIASQAAKIRAAGEGFLKKLRDEFRRTGGRFPFQGGLLEHHFFQCLKSKPRGDHETNQSVEISAYPQSFLIVALLLNTRMGSPINDLLVGHHEEVQAQRINLLSSIFLWTIDHNHDFFKVSIQEHLQYCDGYTEKLPGGHRRVPHPNNSMLNRLAGVIPDGLFPKIQAHLQSSERLGGNTQVDSAGELQALCRDNPEFLYYISEMIMDCDLTIFRIEAIIKNQVNTKVIEYYLQIRDQLSTDDHESFCPEHQALVTYFRQKQKLTAYTDAIKKINTESPNSINVKPLMKLLNCIPYTDSGISKQLASVTPEAHISSMAFK